MNDWIPSAVVSYAQSPVTVYSVSFVGANAFAGWTAQQTVNSTQTLYTVTGLWAYETTADGIQSFMGDSEASFVFGYTE